MTRPCSARRRYLSSFARNPVVIHASTTATAIPEPMTSAPRQSTLLFEWDRARTAENGS